MTNGINISGVVIARNEEHNIGNCIKSLNFCDEIIVIDDFSEDKTVEIAEKYGSQIYRHKLESDYSKQRNFGIEKANGRWVLFLDADEVVSKELATEIIQVASDPTLNFKGFFIKRSTIAFGRKLKHGEFGNTKILRLARKGSGKWKRSVHEYWAVEGKTRLLKNEITHYSFESLFDLIDKINKYSNLHALANRKDGKKSTLFKIIFFPPLKFVNDFFFKKGFLDGTIGFLLSMFMSFHSFLSWGKLWLYQKRQLI